METPLIQGQRVRLLNTPVADTEHLIGKEGVVTHAFHDAQKAQVQFDDRFGPEIYVNRHMVELLEGAPSPVPDPKPTIGRTVHFLSLSDPGRVVPGIVTAVNPDGTVDLTLFYPGAVLNVCNSFVTYGDQPGCWFWPPRVG